MAVQYYGRRPAIEIALTELTRAKPKKRGGSMKGLVFLVVLGGIVAAIYSYGSRPDYKKVIATVEDEIRGEYSKRDGVSVVDVQLIKENDHKLTGFVKLKVANIAVTHSCTVTLAEDFSKYIYGCSP